MSIKEYLIKNWELIFNKDYKKIEGEEKIKEIKLFNENKVEKKKKHVIEGNGVILYSISRGFRQLLWKQYITTCNPKL